MNNLYLIPANTKRSQLIFNVFRPVDLGIILTGFFVSVILLLLVEDNSMTALFLKLLPVGVSAFLVMPVPYYHNALVFIQEMLIYVTKQSRYKWRGWCATHVDENTASK